MGPIKEGPIKLSWVVLEVTLQNCHVKPFISVQLFFLLVPWLWLFNCLIDSVNCDFLIDSDIFIGGIRDQRPRLNKYKYLCRPDVSFLPQILNYNFHKGNFLKLYTDGTSEQPKNDQRLDTMACFCKRDKKLKNNI